MGESCNGLAEVGNHSRLAEGVSYDKWLEGCSLGKWMKGGSQHNGSVTMGFAMVCGNN